MIWQTGTREATQEGTHKRDTVDPARRTVGGTMHVEEYVEDHGLVYLAPETSHSEAQQGPSLNVFSAVGVTKEPQRKPPPGNRPS